MLNYSDDILKISCDTILVQRDVSKMKLEESTEFRLKSYSHPNHWNKFCLIIRKKNRNVETRKIRLWTGVISLLSILKWHTIRLINTFSVIPKLTSTKLHLSIANISSFVHLSNDYLSSEFREQKKQKESQKDVGVIFISSR